MEKSIDRNTFYAVLWYCELMGKLAYPIYALLLQECCCHMKKFNVFKRLDLVQRITCFPIEEDRIHILIPSLLNFYPFWRIAKANLMRLAFRTE
ncbi:hypothetical protein [Paenibacillus sp. FSL M8-0142]|uniref:hypothetical protein n=1 Tax=Paenibacillus sp. FSL M8-0142 TaxID=2954525 RepID=UPI003159CFF5